MERKDPTITETIINSGLILSSIAVGYYGLNYLRSINSYNNHIEKNLYGKCIEDIIDINKSIADIRLSRQ